jgi:hypothetical protein
MDGRPCVLRFAIAIKLLGWQPFPGAIILHLVMRSLQRAQQTAIKPGDGAFVHVATNALFAKSSCAWLEHAAISAASMIPQRVPDLVCKDLIRDALPSGFQAHDNGSHDSFPNALISVL